MELRSFAPDAHILPSRPAHAFNSYLIGDVLIDAGTRWARRRLLRALEGHEVAAHAITHAHSDHQGASHAVCEQLGIPLWCPAGDADAMESGDLRDRSPAGSLVGRFQRRYWAGPAHPVAHRLVDGDEVGGFTVLETPGHSPGHMSLWRESDRTLIAGDVMFGRHPATGRPGLHEPPAMFTVDPARNRQNIRRLAALEPRVVTFGHGPPWHDTAALVRFAEQLPD